MLKALLTLSLATLAVPRVLFAGSLDARFTSDKATYLLGEPVFVSLRVTNNGSKTVWLEFKLPDMAWHCEDFATEVSGAEPPEKWGCGIAVSCGRGLSKVEAGERVKRRRVVQHTRCVLPAVHE